MRAAPFCKVHLDVWGCRGVRVFPCVHGVCFCVLSVRPCASGVCLSATMALTGLSAVGGGPWASAALAWHRGTGRPAWEAVSACFGRKKGFGKVRMEGPSAGGQWPALVVVRVGN